MLANKFNDQFIANKTSSMQGTTCSSRKLMTGGSPYGVTKSSLSSDAELGLGKARASVLNHYTHCNSQKGGAAGHDYDADAVGQTYGYTKAGAAIAGELKGSYAPITVTPKTNMCGGKKKRRKSKKKRKNKSRKSRKRRKSKKRRKSRRRRRRGGMDVEMGKINMDDHKRKMRSDLKAEYQARDRYSSDDDLIDKYPLGLTNSAKAIAKLEKDYKDKYGGEEGLKELQDNYKKLVCEGVLINYGGDKKIHNCEKKGGRRRRRKSRRKSKSTKKRKRRTRKRMKGGRYQQYGSNVPNTPSYSGPYTAGPMPWATGPVGINRQMNC